MRHMATDPLERLHLEPAQAQVLFTIVSRRQQAAPVGRCVNSLTIVAHDTYLKLNWRPFLRGRQPFLQISSYFLHPCEGSKTFARVY